MNAPPPSPEEASPSPEAAFQEILRGVNITETTFHIDDTCNENRGKESIAIIRDVIDQLHELRRNVPDAVLKDSIADKADFLHKVKDAIIDGTYFSSMEDVWESQPKSLDTVDVKLFDRTYDMLEQMPKGYKETINGAIVPTEANDANSVVTDSTSPSAVASYMDIFGFDGEKAPAAHLMPHSRHCASLWYHLVPWVLCRIDDAMANPSITVYDRNTESRWAVVQKCIHGFALQKKAENTPPLEEFESSKRVASISAEGKAIADDNDNNEVGSDALCTKLPAKNLRSDSGDGYALDTKPPAKKTKRGDNIGIKNFKSNRIRLFYQHLYFDTDHCLLIVPILKVDDVKGWNGSGYSAIVLSGIRKNGSAEAVYSDIKAHKGTIEFATAEECNTACELLENMVLCVCKSSKDTFRTDFHKEKFNAALKDRVAQLTKTMEYIESDPKNAPVPTNKVWNNFMVRKITFFCSVVEQNHPPPDPVLLLGKAASNWLKLQGLFVLPGCDEDESTGSGDSSDFVAPLCDEFPIHERRSYDMLVRPPHVKGIVEVTFRPENVEEPLSDDDDE